MSIDVWTEVRLFNGARETKTGENETSEQQKREEKNETKDARTNEKWIPVYRGEDEHMSELQLFGTIRFLPIFFE